MAIEWQKVDTGTLLGSWEPVPGYSLHITALRVEGGELAEQPDKMACLATLSGLLGAEEFETTAIPGHDGRWVIYAEPGER
jgi:hypothetical protein